MNGYNIYYQAKSMALYILEGEGHSLQETADEFGVGKRTVRNRLKLLGYTYKDLAEYRKKKSKQAR